MSRFQPTHLIQRTGVQTVTHYSSLAAFGRFWYAPYSVVSSLACRLPLPGTNCSDSSSDMILQSYAQVRAFVIRNSPINQVISGYMNHFLTEVLDIKLHAPETSPVRGNFQSRSKPEFTLRCPMSRELRNFTLDPPACVTTFPAVQAIQIRIPTITSPFSGY